MIKSKSSIFLKKKAKELKKEIITMAYNGHGAHISSSLSIAEVITVLYWDILYIKPKNPQFKNRDRFILSKGHAASSLFAALSQRGFFSKSILKTYGKDNNMFGVHPEHTVTGIEFSTGSLGHGLSVGCGMALAGKLNKQKYKVYVLISDAELQEGSIWEAALFASHHKLDNLYVFIDYNRVQAFGKTNEVTNVEPLEEKWSAFGWNVNQINGHNIKKLQKACRKKYFRNKPTVIILDTISGFGVSFMENEIKWHYSNLTNELYQQALKEIEETQ